VNGFCGRCEGNNQYVCDPFYPDVRKFVKDLEEVSASKVGRLIELLSEKGHNVPLPFSKKIDKDLYELRVQHILCIRIFYAFYDDGVVLLHAVNKKSQKLLKKDLETARRRLLALRGI